MLIQKTRLQKLSSFITMDYFIDDVNETVHFLIPHFSEYYYQRR
ncbi:MAG: hypothetical protein ACE5PV_19445 [Candidatus Poribacteria bacterium]